MATYTENYQLHQWGPEDDFLRTDFNTDFQKIDAALQEIKEMAQGRGRAVYGNYTGTGAASRTIYTSGTPKALLLSNGSSTFAVIDDGDGYNSIAITTSGFTAKTGSPNMNQSGKRYHYVAIF